jgi:hypothetical protein
MTRCGRTRRGLARRADAQPGNPSRPPLPARGEQVVHIVDAQHIGAATLTPGAQLQADGTLTYPAQ